MKNIVSIENGQSLASTLIISEGVGYDHSTVIRLVRDNKEDLEEFGPLGFQIHVVNRPQGGGAKTEYAMLNEDQATLLMTYMRNNAVIKAFKKQLVKAFSDLRNEKEISMPDFSSPALAARAWADQYEARLLAEKTKAEIGSKREATAMATASAATRKANKLEIELDQSSQYCTVKRMQMIHHGQKFNWRLLKSTATEMNIPPKDVFDANYGTVKAYHLDVWQEAYAVTIDGESIAA